MRTGFKKWFPRFLRIGTHIGALAPLAVLVWDYYTDNLTVNPIQAAEQRTGLIALTLLLLSLACTPINILFGGFASQAIKRRRALGLYAFMYAGIHLTLFVWVDYGLDWSLIGQTLLEKRYIFVGMGAFLALLPLAVTSFRWWIKRMGKNWIRLHRLVYLAGGLVIVHFAWVVKGNVLQFHGDVRRVLLYGAILILLFVVRIPPVRRAIVNARLSGTRTSTDSRGGLRREKPVHEVYEDKVLMGSKEKDKEEIISMQR